MPEVRISESISQDWVRCSIDEFGAFISSLTALTDNARDAEIDRTTSGYRRRLKEITEAPDLDDEFRAREIGRAEAEIESARERVVDSFLPSWSTTVRGRHTEARGTWETVRGQVEFAAGGTARIGIGSAARPPAFTVLVLNRGMRIEMVADSPDWLDERVPVIKHQLRRMRPRGGWYPRTLNTTVLGVTSLVALLFSLYGLLTLNTTFTAVGAIACVPMIASLWVSNVPAIRFGPAPTRWWLTWGKWALVTIAGAILGGVVTRLLGLE